MPLRWNIVNSCFSNKHFGPGAPADVAATLRSARADLKVGATVSLRPTRSRRWPYSPLRPSPFRCVIIPHATALCIDTRTSPSRFTSLADGDEQAALLPKLANPAQLRQPCLRQPIVGCILEEIARFFAKQGAGIRPHVVDAVFLEPALNLRQGMTVFLWMPILVAPPRLASCRFIPAIMQHRIKGNPSVAGAAGNQAAQPER